MDEIAILGGPKAINTPSPHWSWPPKSSARIDAVARYLENPVDNANGYPLAVEDFERRFAAYHNTEFALSMSSGTSTLHAAFFAVGVGPGDEVIAPTMTFIATATPIIQFDAVPVLCDCEPDTGNIDPADIRRRITKRTKAIVITHLCGHPCDMDAITAIAREHGVALIEDCSHAHGATYNGRKVGTFGDISCFSLGRKILSCGEAGVLLTNNRLYFERALMLTDFGPRLFGELTLPETRRYVDTGFGTKSRIHPLSAVILGVEFESLDDYIVARKEKLDYLSDKMIDIPGLAPPITREGMTRGGYYGYRPFYKPEELNDLSLAHFLAALHAEGMEVRQSNNPPLHHLPLFIDYCNKAGREQPSLPNSDQFFRSTLSLPTFTYESFDILDQYAEAFTKVSRYFSSHRNVNIDQIFASAN